MAVVFKEAETFDKKSATASLPGRCPTFPIGFLVNLGVSAGVDFNSVDEYDSGLPCCEGCRQVLCQVSDRRVR